jgi:trimeric autotransporter adhesin
VSGTSVANKIYNGNATATLSGGYLVGLVGADSLTLTQAGNFAAAGPGVGIAVTANDAVSGTSAGNYIFVQPTGLTGKILPLASTTGGGGSTGGTSGSGTTGGTTVAPAPDPALAAATSQLQGNGYALAAGTQPGSMTIAPTLIVVPGDASPAGAQAGTDVSAGGSDSVVSLSGGKAIAVNVSMKIGAVGTLQIKNGGMLLPEDLVQVSP